MKQTEIILLQRVPKLGGLGDVVKVKPGFARNFLLPNNMALRATKDNIVFFQEKKEQLIAKNADLRAKAEVYSEKIRNTVITIIRHAGENGHLYGSVSAKDLAGELWKLGHKVSTGQIELSAPLKELGVFSANVSLHADVNVPFLVNIAKSQDEAQSQLDAYMSADDKLPLPTEDSSVS
ncbi:MAG: 50S ribosomal protein L9 [Holosporales bacterium]|jgi:large subunit ribosomal protein L9|nr:50S ribosomal protein L9 [Holosporales bacterium]